VKLPCVIQGCGKPRRSAKLCAMHWNRLQRNGDPTVVQVEMHGLGDSPEYSVWEAMHERCRNPKAFAYSRYGGRGIYVCARWKSFTAFLADMGPRPAGYTIDRINNDGNYEPTNCRWATREQQQNNMRRNRYVALRGKKVTIAEAARILKIPYDTAHGRVRRGLNLETGER
jgi:hypothetical protein